MTVRTVLVANRGEIAVRVMRSAHASGLRTVAVHTDLDGGAPHVRAADEAVRVSSYLDVGDIVTAALASGADAVHPGYGFLSERASFARSVTAAGLVFVGPPAEVIDRMGRKDVALEVARAAGVPVLPRFVLDAAQDGAAVGEQSWFPLLVKAAAGGGGKGMRIVRDPRDLQAALDSARREATAAFGDDTVLLERYVEHGRHIEVQVLADQHGTVVHLFDRDCSPQRRHQKVLEEAPAPTISAEVRRVVTESAVALAREVGYSNAGTVEFLLDVGPSAEPPGVYFLEMNTRLQVEHPVTEAVVRVDGRPLDLVALQLQVAAGEPLPFTQDQVSVSGHAIEARVYAEDPYRGFLPQAGVAELVRWPGDVRVDHALESGQEVSTAYDPMLGKVVAHGPDREAARRALVDALDRTAVLGLTTNTGFLRALVAGDAFRDAAIDTAWLDRTPLEEPDPAVARLFAAWVQAMLAGYDGPAHPFQPDGWRVSGPPAPFLVALDRQVVVERSGDGTGRVDGVGVHQVSAENHVAVLSIDGRRLQAVVNARPHSVEVSLHGQRHVFRPPDVNAQPGEATGDGSVTAPMPGTVLSVAVSEGQQVDAGDVLGILEAMKMELSLPAPVSGTVTAVRAAAGDRVALDAVVFVVTPGRPEDGGTPARSAGSGDGAG